jgi:hypothetical protein
MWLGMLVVVLLAFALTRTRRKTTHPYPHSTHWRDEVKPAEAAMATSKVQLAAQESMAAHDGSFTAAYGPRQPIAAFGNAGPGNPPWRLGRHGRYDTAPERSAMGARPAGPRNSARDWPTAPDGLASVGPGGASGPSDPSAPSGLGGQSGVGGPVDQGSQSWVPRWLDSGMHREPRAHGGTPGRPAYGGAIPGDGIRGGAASGMSASSNGSEAAAETASWAADMWSRQGHAARPPWPAAHMPGRDAETHHRDQIDPHAPWSGEVDPR